MIDGTVQDWLLDSDPTLRWQVQRDLLGASPDVWRATRARIALEGDGARLLSYQDPDGRWAGGAFFPGGFDFAAQDQMPGQPYTATTWTLTTLREWGWMPPCSATRRTGSPRAPVGSTTICRTGTVRSMSASTR